MILNNNKPLILKMPKATVKFVVELPIWEVWSIISDSKSNQHCIPGCIACDRIRDGVS